MLSGRLLVIGDFSIEGATVKYAVRDRCLYGVRAQVQRFASNKRCKLGMGEARDH